MTMSMPAEIDGGNGRAVVGVDLVDAGPVGHDEARETELALEDLGQQVMVAVDLAGARARERGHDDPDAGLDRVLVGRPVEGAQRRLVDVGHALVDGVARRGGRAPDAAAVAEEVLGGRRRGVGRGEIAALETADGRARRGRPTIDGSSPKPS